MNLFSSEDPFVDRNQLKKTTPGLLNYQEEILEQVKNIDITKISDEVNPKTRSQIIEKQKVYFWIRLYLREEDQILDPNDTVNIRYTHSGEILETKFICYNKSILTQDADPNVVNYNPEDDKKVLCLMVDADSNFEKSLGYMNARKYNMPVYHMASSVPEQIFAGSLPTTVVFDKQGRLSFKHEGAANYNSKKFADFIEKLKTSTQ